MRSATYLGVTTLATLASAHTTIYNIYVNDVDQGIGNSADGYIRSPPNNDPVKDIESSDLTCNVNNVATAQTLSVAGGDKITFEWHHNGETADDDIIASSHKGPVMVYIAPTESDGDGDVWVKLAEDGYSADTELWAVDTLISNKGLHSVMLPDLAAGEYLLRAEIIALHEADTAYNVNSARGAQFYMECVQIEVNSTGTTSLPTGVAIPGAYSYSDPGVVFNLYGTFTEYTIPGPAVWDGTSSSTVDSASTAVIATSSTATAIATSAASTETAVSPTAATETSIVLSTSSTFPLIAKTTSTFKSAASTKSIGISSTASVTETSVPTSTDEEECEDSVPTTLVTKLSSTIAAAETGTAETVELYGQCGGSGYTGATSCVSGATCTMVNDWYSQCVSS